ncbi:hypothetical protein [Bacillus niameyensis]|uniref:hypothetical protein n=1 Tax=Bacillus niameyensis TaxID=1522308 RepID=UPI0007843F16|nr:hypothetical protein [Bacillus niameyensis]
MNTHNEMSWRELKLYMAGVIVVVGIFILTLVFSRFATPLLLLKIRLSVMGIGFIYFISIFIFYERIAAINLNLQDKMSEIIIIINGKELRR